MAKKERITQGMAIHRWAQLTPKVELTSDSGSIRIEGRRLYYQDDLVAYVHNYRRKIVAIAPFYNGGAYGNGLSNYSIIHALPPDAKIVYLDEIADSYTDYQLFKASVDYHINEYLVKVAPLTRVINGIDRAVHIDYNKQRVHLKLAFDKLFILFDRSINDRYLNKVHKHKIWFKKYRGWRADNEVTDDVEYTGRELYYNGLFTRDEQIIIERADWIHLTFHNTPHAASMSKSDKEAIYDDVEQRAKWTTKIEDFHLRARKYNEQLELAEQKEKLKDWLLGKNVQGLFHIPIHLRIKGDVVQTTQRAEVPISHAKRLFQFFNKCVESGNGWASNGITHKVGHFSVSIINKDADDNWYLIAGCHTIYEREITKFINDNKLDWL